MPKLIGKDGRPVFGLHEGPIKEFNIKDLRPYGENSKVFYPHHKRWMFLGVSNKDVFFGLAVVHLGYLANLFAYIFDRKGKKLIVERDVIVPLGFGAGFSGSSFSGSVSFKSGGVSAGVMINTETIKLDADLGHGFSADLVYSRIKNSLNVVTRNGLKGFNYTNKDAGLSVQGGIKADSLEYVIEPSVPAGSFDYTLGILKRNTFWNWASGGGIDTGGRKIGFNFAQGVNETGFTENVFWVDGKMIKVDNVDFKYDDLNLLGEWKIKSSDGKVDISFKPEGERAKNLNLGLIVSCYHQPFGTFTGILYDGKDKCELKEVYGFTEEHEAVW